jgi:hypothetical protein
VNTECKQFSFDFQPLGRREVVARFDAPAITSDGGGLLLREIESKFGLIRQFAECFDDFRRPLLVKHTVEELLAQRMRANQLRIWLSSVAYVLVNALRELGLKGTEFEKSQCQTIRLKLFKIGAAIRVTVRKVWVSLSGSYPYAKTFQQIFANLNQLAPVQPLIPIAVPPD